MYKKQEIDNYSISTAMTKQFKAAIYCRISNEDTIKELKNSESESIKNQKDILTKYVLEQGWELVDVYIDDGYTGTNFDRPGFNRLINDVESGLVNLVITKDLSRLGRDYIDTGYYLEKYFPEKRVRYIALNDGVDTFESSSKYDITPFRSVINDMYAKDISVKVRSSMDSKRMNGKFIGAFAPYGYEKDPKDKNRLVINEETAPVVKRIFTMYLQGMGLGKIAHILNEERVITPTEYKVKTSNYKGTSKVSLWNTNTVKCILKNPTYTGYLAQNKCKKVSYKSKKMRAVPREDWIVVEGTHEPIVDIQVFQDAQKIMYRKSNPNYCNRKTTKLFSGFVFCGDCEAYMTYTSTPSGKEYLICSTYKRFSSKYCSRHSLMEDELKQMVIEDIRKIVQLTIDKTYLMDAVKRKRKNLPIQNLHNDMKNIERRLEEIKRINKSLYQDKFKGIITEEEFVNLNNEFNKERFRLNETYQALKQKLDSLSEQSKETEKVYQLVEDVLQIKRLDRYVLEKLISKIEVYEDKHVKIEYRFKNPLE